MPKKRLPEAAPASAPDRGITAVRISTELVSMLKIMAAVESTSMKDLVERFVRDGVADWQKSKGMKLSMRPLKR